MNMNEKTSCLEFPTRALDSFNPAPVLLPLKLYSILMIDISISKYWRGLASTVQRKYNGEKHIKILARLGEHGLDKYNGEKHFQATSLVLLVVLQVAIDIELSTAV
jgi:hypothetical protein